MSGIAIGSTVLTGIGHFPVSSRKKKILIKVEELVFKNF
jgi:hypothetical protein